MNYSKEILERGYVTHALTDENGKVYGMNVNESINFVANPIELNHTFYWSEVYCEANYMATVIRKGTLLINPTPEKLGHYFTQSKVNLH